MIDERFDRLASLFLGDHEPTPTDGMEAMMGRGNGPPGRGTPPGYGGSPDDGDPLNDPARVMVITPMVAGNLPVLAHPWLWHVAARLDARPTALLRLAADGVQVAMLNASGPAESDRSDLAAWLLEAATVARRWWVVPRSGGEIDAVSALKAEEIVVVTGGDEAATVAAYQLVRRLVESAKSEGRGAPMTPLAVVGCTEAAAREAAATVSTAAQAFLGHPVPMAGAFPRLERTPVSHQRFFAEAVQPSELRAAIHMAGDAAWAGKAASAAGAPAPVPTPAIEATSSVAASVPAVVGPRPESLAACIPGLWSVSVQWPGHPHVEFATDQAGRLHLLADVQHAASLRLARAWAQRSGPLLRSSFPGLSSPLQVVERLVFVQEAVRAVDWHHAGILLDLLIPSAAGWMHVPLNDDASKEP